MDKYVITIDIVQRSELPSGGGGSQITASYKKTEDFPYRLLDGAFGLIKEIQVMTGMPFSEIIENIEESNKLYEAQGIKSHLVDSETGEVKAKNLDDIEDFMCTICEQELCENQKKQS